MATARSIQAYKINQQAGGEHNVLNSNEKGQPHKAYFAWQSTTVGTADTVELCKVPAQAKIVGVYLDSDDALGQTVDIGDADDDNRLCSEIASAALTGYQNLVSDATAFTSATKDSGPDTGFGYTYTAETTITLTSNADSLTANVNLRGFIEYLL